MVYGWCIFVENFLMTITISIGGVYSLRNIEVEGSITKISFLIVIKTKVDGTSETRLLEF
jgi:hypothetical protein